MQYHHIKRALDVAASGACLVVTAPLQAVVALTVWKAHGRPILFRQSRPGRGGEIFELIKFRSMLEPDGLRASDAERLTPLGKVLRATSLDELPTLWNVFRGDMSLVGPRPLLVDYLQLYSPEQARRHLVHPGITGLAQISGRNDTTWERRLELDVAYVDSMSLAVDARILLMTVRTVLRRDGISGKGEATMTRFLGNKKSS